MRLSGKWESWRISVDRKSLLEDEQSLFCWKGDRESDELEACEGETEAVRTTNDK